MLNQPSRAVRCFGEKELDEVVSAGSNSIRIPAVDDHPLFRSGIAALLATQPDISLVAEASNGREAIEKFREDRPDITLMMDLQMPETVLKLADEMHLAA
jgi:DNA-binding NarL/FixJ family response regulator